MIIGKQENGGVAFCSFCNSLLISHLGIIVNGFLIRRSQVRILPGAFRRLLTVEKEHRCSAPSSRTYI